MIKPLILVVFSTDSVQPLGRLWQKANLVLERSAVDTMCFIIKVFHQGCDNVRDSPFCLVVRTAHTYLL